MKRLSGKRIFVTGAGGEIGIGICKAFLAQGARVAAADTAADLASAILEFAAEGQALALACDVTDPSSVAEAIGLASGFLGGLDTLCIIAGGSTGDDGRVTDVPDAEFLQVLQVDLLGMFLTTKFGIPELIGSGGGTIISVSSMLPKTGAADHTCHAASRGAIDALTRAMAAGHAHENIRVNAIIPASAVQKKTASKTSVRSQSAKRVKGQLPGLADIEDVAALATYFASDDAKRITGQIVSVDKANQVA